MKSLMSVMIVLAITGVASATFSYDTSAIEYVAGSGSNSATVAIDFDEDDYFVFTFNWNDGEGHTGWDVLSALDTAGDLAVAATDYGSWGMFVDDIDYPGGTEYDYGVGVNTGWVYYVSADNNNWQASSIGVSFRELSNGDFDSWVWTNYDENWAPIRTPGAAPVPEPATMLLLGLGGFLLRRRR